MTNHGRTLAAVRAALKRARKPLSMAELLPRVEERLEQVVGRTRLYLLICTTQSKTREFKIAGHGEQRTYALAKVAR